MVEQSKIDTQLQRIGFNIKAWGRQEVRELHNVILPDEEIYECVNGIYEGGFALLVATDLRVLLIDKKPFNFLTVEDLRFDMINEIDYNHRAVGAYVDITTGNRELKFRSYNQNRLRNLISHVQRRMAEIKRKQDSHQEGQNQHLEQINQQLRTYLTAQFKHQEELQRRLEAAQKGEVKAALASPSPEPPKPSPELSDYLLAQGLLEDHLARAGQSADGLPEVDASAVPVSVPGQAGREDLLTEGLKEIFGDSKQPAVHAYRAATRTTPAPAAPHTHHPFDINPLRIAYSKLPMAMRNRRFGRPSLHAHSQAARDKIAGVAALAEPLVEAEPEGA